MSGYYIHPSGNDLNSGGTDTDAAQVTADATGGTLVANVLTDNGVDFVAAGVSTTSNVCMVVGGANTRRKITVVAQHTLTLTGGAGNETYTGYRVGGATRAIEQVVNSAAGKNVPLASRDTVDLQPNQTFHEWTITVAQNIVLRGNAATIDGTGGGAGTNVLQSGVLDWSVKDLTIINAVASGFGLTAGGGAHIQVLNCKASACVTGFIQTGGSGGAFEAHFCSGRSCTTGINDTIAVAISAGGANPVIVGCDFSDNTSRGCTSTGGFWMYCLVEGNGSHGFDNFGGNALLGFVNCTIRGNGGDGINCAITTPFPACGSGMFLNNVVADNTGKGVNCSGGALTTLYKTDYNCFFNNAGGDRVNFDTGAHDIASNPLFTDPTHSNFTPAAGSPLIGAGMSVFQTGNNMDIGAVTHGAVSTDLNWLQRFTRARKQYETVGPDLRYRAYDPTDDATLVLDQTATDRSGGAVVLSGTGPAKTAKSSIAVPGGTDDATWLKKVARGRKVFETVGDVVHWRVYSPDDDTTILVDQITTDKGGSAPVLEGTGPAALSKSAV